MINLTFQTLADARKHCANADLGGVYIVEGKGEPYRPWAVLDCGLAADLISDEIGLPATVAMLGDLDRRGQYIVRMADYHREAADAA